MNYTLTKRLFAGFAICFFSFSIIFTIGCAAKRVEVGYEEDDQSGYSDVNYKKGGPPPHAPAYGYRAKHQYRYYPSRSVYYDIGRKIYFYIEGDHWEVAASLPGSLRVGLGDYVSMELDTEKPYLYNAEHAKKYPPGQLKKNKNKKQK